MMGVSLSLVVCGALMLVAGGVVLGCISTVCVLGIVTLFVWVAGGIGMAWVMIEGVLVAVLLTGALFTTGA